MTSLEAHLKAENKALKERIRFFENMLKVSQDNAKRAKAAIEPCFLDAWGCGYSARAVKHDCFTQMEADYNEYMKAPLLTEIKRPALHG